jgi:hypothetical protein
VGLVALLVAACGESGPRPISLSIDPASPSLAQGTQLPVTATVLYSDGRVADVTTRATWASSDESVVRIVADGCQGLVADGVNGGTAVVTAHFGVTGSTTIAVTSAALAELAVYPASTSVAEGTDQQFSAIGTFTDTSIQDLTEQVTWSSTDPLVAEFSAGPCTKGMALALTSASVTIQASYGAVQADAQLLVTPAQLRTIEIAPFDPSLAVATTLPLAATGVFDDQTTQDLTKSVLWTSASPAVVTVSSAAGSEGLLTGAAAGSTQVTATLGGVSAAVPVEVSSAALVVLEIAPLTPELPAGMSTHLSAIGTFSDGSTQDVTAGVTWGSSDALVASVSNANAQEGFVSAIAVGAADVSATLGAVSTSIAVAVTDATLVSLVVTPPVPALAAGFTRPLSATGTFSDGSTRDLSASVTWASSNPSVAAVSNAAGSQGLVLGLVPGTTDVRATLGPVTESTTVSVSTAVLVSLAIMPASPTLAAGFTRELHATGTFSDTSTQDLTASVTWASPDALVASISNAAGSAGLLTAVAIGAVDVNATLGGVSTSTAVSVSAATLVTLAISPPSASVRLGQSLQLIVTGTFSDSSTLDLTASVTWGSTNRLLLLVSNALGLKGLATALALGSGQISATLGAVTTSAPFDAHL